MKLASLEVAYFTQFIGVARIRRANSFEKMMNSENLIV